MISFRITDQLKKKLEDRALRERRSLSSCIVRIVQDSLESQEYNTPPRGMQEDRRDHSRKQVLLPARLRIRHESDSLEHDVLLRNISVGGAYTEYVNGQNMQLIKSLQVSPLALAVRMPESKSAILVDCKVSRIHITGDCIGVGLHFIDTAIVKSLIK
jgi:hypothetical protein